MQEQVETGKDLTSYRLACIAARLLDNKLAKDITILNISNVSVISDYFVICSGEATTQVRALTGNVREQIKKVFNRPPNSEESDTRNSWNLLDYGDVIVHILHKEEREAYAIEKFWNHALQIEEAVWMSETDDIKDLLL